MIETIRDSTPSPQAKRPEASNVGVSNADSGALDASSWALIYQPGEVREGVVISGAPASHDVPEDAVGRARSLAESYVRDTHTDKASKLFDLTALMRQLEHTDPQLAVTVEIAISDANTGAFMVRPAGADVEVSYDGTLGLLTLSGERQAVQKIVNEIYFHANVNHLKHFWIDIRIKKAAYEQADASPLGGDMPSDMNLEIIHARLLMFYEKASGFYVAHKHYVPSSGAAQIDQDVLSFVTPELRTLTLPLNQLSQEQRSLFDAAGPGKTTGTTLLDSLLPALSESGITAGGDDVPSAPSGTTGGGNTPSEDTPDPVTDETTPEPTEPVTTAPPPPPSSSGNAPPAATVPGAQVINEDATLNLNAGSGNGISISEPDGDDPMTVTLSVGQGTLTLAVVAGLTFTSGANGDATFTIQATLADINAAIDSLSYTPNADYSGADTIVVLSDDGNGGTHTGMVPVTVTAINDAPEMDNSGAMLLAAIAEDDVTNGGSTVASILASSAANGGDAVTDADSGALEGIAVTSVDNSNGTWEYKVGAGAWTGFAGLAGNNALLLAATDSIRFVPNASYSGLGGDITFHAWDQTSGTAGGFADPTLNGGTTAFSTTTETATISVSNTNNDPVVSNLDATLTINETDAQSGNQLVDSAVDVLDIDSLDFDGGQIRIEYSGAANTDDQLTIRDQGTGAGQIGFSSITGIATMGGVAFATVNGANDGANGNDLIFDLNASATPVAVELLLENLLYQSTSQVHDSARTLEVTLTDGDGGASATQNLVLNVTDESESYGFTAGDDTLLGGTADDTISGDADDWGTSDIVSLGGGTNSINLTGAGSANPGASAVGNLEVSLADVGAYLFDLAASGATSMTIDGSLLSAANILSVDVGGFNNALSITGGAGDDTITGGNATIRNTLSITGGAGDDVLQIDDNADIRFADTSNLAGVDLIELLSNVGRLEINDALVNNSDDGDILYIDQGAFSLTNLRTNTLSGPNEVVVMGGGVVSLSNNDNNSVRVADGVNGSINGSNQRETITGGDGDDTFDGNRDHDLLIGGAGNDSLDGDRNNDTLEGGAGSDTLTGGQHNDVYRYLAASDSTALSMDLITDFSLTQDTIDVTGLGALNYLDNASFTGTTNELRWEIDVPGNRTFVEADIDADAIADLRIQLTGQHGFNFDHFVGTLTDVSGPIRLHLL